MKTLYIVGNGFDIHHKLDTKYQSFAYYLAENDCEVYELLLNYYGLPDITNPNLTVDEYGLWSRFEQALADLDYIQVLDDHLELIACPGAEDFRDRDWNTYQIEMEGIVEKLTVNLIKDFNSFILRVNYENIPEEILINLEKDSHFLNFNYTETLQRLYAIPEERITYIHSRAIADHCQLILGHGSDPSNFMEKKEEPPHGLNEDELYEWRERKAEDFDLSYDNAKRKILSYFGKVFKNTAEIIKRNEAFYSSITGIEKVIVLGHSISEIDLKYFQEVRDHALGNPIWYVSYFGEYEKQIQMKTLQKIGIIKDVIVQIKLGDLKR